LRSALLLIIKLLKPDRLLDYLAKRDDVNPDQIAVFGISRGGELAMLSATLFPQISAVVSVVGSPVGWGDAIDGEHGAWTFHGKDVPFVSTSQAWTSSKHTERFGNPTMLRKQLVRKAFFKLEKAHGPMLVIGAGRDELWDSASMATAAKKYMQSHSSCFSLTAVIYPKAGHLFWLSTDPVLQPSATTDVGNDPVVKDYVEASQDAWRRIFTFLGKVRPTRLTEVC